MTNTSRLGLASVIVLLAGCTAQSTSTTQVPAAAPAPVAAAPAPPAPVVAPAPAPAPVVAAPAASLEGGLPAGENRDLVIRACSGCHDTFVFAGLRHPRPVWSNIVDSMMSRGAQLSNDERVLVENYLATYLGPQ